MTLLFINGVAMPSPVTYNVTMADIHSESSSRNDQGVMTAEVVRSNVANLSLSWEFLTQSEFETIMTNIRAKELPVRFYYGDGYKTATMYKGDRNIKMNHLDGLGSRWSLDLNLIEY